MWPDAHAHTFRKALLLFLLLLHRGSKLLIVISQRPDHILVQSVLTSPDHTHSCLSYCLQLRSIIGWVNPHIWHALKIALTWSYAQKMHVYIFQIQKALLPVFHQVAGLLTTIFCSVTAQKFKGRCLKVHWSTWTSCYFSITWYHVVATHIAFYVCVQLHGEDSCAEGRQIYWGFEWRLLYEQFYFLFLVSLFYSMLHPVEWQKKNLGE